MKFRTRYLFRTWLALFSGVVRGPQVDRKSIAQLSYKE